MAKAIINEIVQLIKDQIEEQEVLKEFIGKALAFIEVASNEHFLENKKEVIELYLYGIGDFLGQISLHNQLCLDNLMEIPEFLEKNQTEKYLK